MREKKFNVGDTVTYKQLSKYFFGGQPPKDLKQTIISYGSYVSGIGCYEICVTHDTGPYSMLEKEFEEYDAMPTEVSNYSVF